MARLTAAERHALPASAFALPERREMPLVDSRHASNALARLGQPRVFRSLTREQRARALRRILAAQSRFRRTR